ncbi:DEAD/DEAH box helicase [Rhizobium leguminosarum]|uniref:DEAD/DEAH box helicase n=1 Tax=Rhizobium leguminosarum TaxID=384 RepID=UPI001C910CA0|nr:DEAD/DEAH box helicase family protein [Rhizobium leguminosarum]MBY2910814.1 DEAD/DEAH box helicase family protein [Rhizobium leguminosarum]
MAEDLLTFLEQSKPLDLPPITLGPIKTPVGYISCLLRVAESVQSKPVGDVKISPRVEVPLFVLSNGEKIVISSRKSVIRPPDVDGILLQTETGHRWLSHVLTDELTTAAEQSGWPSVVASRAQRWDGQFSFRKELPDEHGFVADDRKGLRPAQLGALHAIGSHWSLYKQPATIVMPTGTGKTETMLSALAAYTRDPLLVIVPSDALRSQTARKFLGFGLLRSLGVLQPNVPNPIVGVLTKVPKAQADLEIFDRCNVIVTTMTSIADSGAEPVWPATVGKVGAVIIDEAHHVGARRWARFKDGFASRPILQFTATPFRRDGALVEGQVIFNYPLRMAQADGYFRTITFEPVYEPNPSTADRSIAEAAVARLRADLQEGYNHLMMARCETIKRAEAVCAVYEAIAPDLRPLLIHSEQADRQARIDRLIDGECKIAVCVNMLGEGFDLPQLKVAAIHDLHKSLAILLQFTGRFTRSSGKKIGNASVVANIAEPNVSAALERLYSEDADWNQLLSEMSSQAAQDHARLIQFLSEARRLDSRDDEDDAIVSDKLLRPTFSTLFFEAAEFTPKRFYDGLPGNLEPYRVWLHEPSSTLFFVTREEPTVKWARSKSVRDKLWSLFVLHFDEARNLLYLSSTDHSSSWEPLAKAVGANRMLSGDTVFRGMGRINRLIFQNVGVRKHGRRNLSYASYTGAEVVSALGLAEKAGSIKAMLSGQGWEDGRQITIGCSAKGRVWSREQGTIPRFNDWAEGIGDKLRDPSLDMSKLIDNVLLPTSVTAVPAAELLSIEWPVEMLRMAEERIAFNTKTRSDRTQITFELKISGRDQARHAIQFDLIEASDGVWGSFEFALGGPNDFYVTQITGEEIVAIVGKIEGPLADYFSNYPPLFRFIDLSELDANLHITPQNPYEMIVDEGRFESWDWKGVDLKKESIWKNGEIRKDSIQSKVAQYYVDEGFDIVFDDDDSGEAADLVCMRLEQDAIRLALVHCKFSGGKTAGERVKDVVEVSSQAVRSARWIGKFQALLQHLRGRNDQNKRGGRATRFIRGTSTDLSQMTKISRVLPVRTEILIAQPGLSKAARTADQSIVVAAMLTYLKETVGLDVRLICSP